MKLLFNNLLSLGLNDELSHQRRLRVFVMNRIALISIAVVLVLWVVNWKVSDSTLTIIYYSFYLLTSIWILIAHYYKKYILSDYIFNILFPLCIVFSAVCVGKEYHVEYLLFLTGGATNFYIEKGKVRHLLFIFNVILLVFLKIYFYYHADGLLELNMDYVIFYNTSLSVLAMVTFYSLLEINLKINKKLRGSLKKISNAQGIIIEERTKEIQVKSEKLERSNQEIKRFAGIASHDLREPIRNIMGFSQLLERSIKKDQKEHVIEYLGYIKNSINRIDTLTKDIEDYTRLEDKVDAINVVKTEEIIDGIFNQFKEEHKGFFFNRATLPIVKMNGGLCETLFYHLIKNATQYTSQPSGWVEITSEKKSDFHQFSIRDTGVGIDEKYFETVFGMFKRLHNDLNKNGSGIGLSICKKIVESYGGKIWVESTKGQGSTFFFELPR